MPKSTISEPRPRALPDYIRHAEGALAAAGIDNAPLDARVLVAHALHIDRIQLIIQTDRALTDDEIAQLDIFIARRARREPVHRILGAREFWGLPFGLNTATLVPRPDSETVVEAALKGVERSAPLRILDLGAGTGCLLLALLHELPNASGLGVDCAPQAVEQASQNAAHLGFAARAGFKASDWAEGIDERFDLIVSNPPYIARGEIAALMPEVRDHDPRLALDGGEDGLAAYRLLVPRLPALLKPNGTAVFEIGEGQARTVRTLFEKAGFEKISIHRDLGGIERCVAGSGPA